MVADTFDINEIQSIFKNVERVPGSKKPDPIIVAQNVVRKFGGLTAVDVDRVEIQRGSITALIGPNGAGKSTFFNLLTTFDQADEGKWYFNNVDITKFTPNELAQKGLVRTFQLTKALSRLSVLDNVRLGAKNQIGEWLFAALLKPLWIKRELEVTAQAEETLAQFNLLEKKSEFAGSLSGGQRKLLEMARALMLKPEIIMLDEPMAGVNPALKQSLLGHIKNIRKNGTTVLFVEHDMDMVNDISDWVIVMAQGKIIAEGPPNEVMKNKNVIDAYLGSHHKNFLTQDGKSLSSDKQQ